MYVTADCESITEICNMVIHFWWQPASNIEIRITTKILHECEEQNLTVWLQITNKQNIRKHQNYNNENYHITYWLNIIILVDNIFIYILCCHSDTCSYSHWCDWHLWHSYQSWTRWHVWWSHASTGEHLLVLYCILMISCPMELPFDHQTVVDRMGS